MGTPLKLYFCFPYRGVGGVSLLFLRVAEWLADQGLAECHLVDYLDGFMARHMDPARVSLLPYEDAGSVRIPADGVLILQSMTPWSIFPGLAVEDGARVLFWNCHPYNLVPTLPGFRRTMQRSRFAARVLLGTLLRGYRGKMRAFVTLLDRGRSIVFMDHANHALTADLLGLELPHPVYLPIPARGPMEGGAAPRSGDPHGMIRLAWIGRVVDFKYFPLRNALLRCNEAQPHTGLPFRVTIVGDGEFLTRLKGDCASLANLEVRFVDHVDPQALDAFLVQEVDILFAMGTSALEGAKLGVPTILLDFTYAEVPERYGFTWLHHRRGFTLGDLIGPEHLVATGGTLTQRVREWQEDRAGLSQAARAYFQANHDLGAVSRKLVSCIGQTTCTWKDLRCGGFLKPGLLYGSFRALRRKAARS